jgi:hypothetical protein
MILNKAYSVPHLVRLILESEDTFEGAVKRFKEAKLIACIYIIVSGTEQN